MKHIMILILIMLTISPTTAECERGFSSVNNIKTIAGTSMKQEACLVLLELRLMVLILWNTILQKAL